MASKVDSWDVFLSYAHDDDEELGCASDLAAALQAAGFSVWWDRELRGAQDWHAVITSRMEASALIVALWSKKALSRPMCRFESAYAAGKNKLFPVALEDIEPSDFTDELKGLTYRLNRVKFDVAELVKQISALVKASNASSARVAAVLLASEGINLPPVLTSGSGFLAGRDEEEAMLLDAWASCAPGADPRKKVHVLVVHAIGGAGKTALMRRLVDRLAEQNFPNADKVLGWSAYSQGSGENRCDVSASTFISEALTFMGHRAEMPRDPIVCARLLAARLRQTRTLLILDGIEPLQHLPDVKRGQLKDEGLKRLLQDLALQGHPGLVVITSRQHLPELENRPAPAVRNHALDHLSVNAGVQLLRHLHCYGKASEMEKAVKEVEGHALTITLLGTYLFAVEDGDIAKRDQLKLTNIVLTPEGVVASDDTARLARRSHAVMKGYIARFEELSKESKGKGEAERLILSILALFNRPAEGGAVRTLLAGKPIRGLTDVFASWSVQEKAKRLRVAKHRLRELKLLAEANPDDADSIDCHPIVRAYFEHNLLEVNSRGYHEAQTILGKYYADLAKAIPHFDVSNDDRTDAKRIHFWAMAIYHECRTGQAEHAFVNLYQRHLQEDTRYYLTSERHLGAYALSILANFFIEPWHKVRPVGQGLVTVRILNEAAFGLRSVGRLDEAAQAYQAAIDLAERIGRHLELFKSGFNLVNIYLVLGHLEKALALARKLEANYTSLDGIWVNQAVQVNVFAVLADTLYQLGNAKEAVRIIRKATKISEEQSPPLMTIANRVSLQIYLGGGNIFEGVSKAGAYHDRLTRERKDDLVAIAFCEIVLALGLAASDSTDEAARLLDNAVLKLRQAAREDVLPHGLLARAAFRRQMFQKSGNCTSIDPIREDLAEVEEIARRGSMKLHLADFHLESARLCLAQIAVEPDEGPIPGIDEPPSTVAASTRHGRRANILAKLLEFWPAIRDSVSPPRGTCEAPKLSLPDAAEEHLQKACELIEETHYRRRDPERAELRTQIDGVAAHLKSTAV